MTNFKEAWRAISSAVHSNARDKGFWDAHEGSVSGLESAGLDDLARATNLAFLAQKLKLIGDELAEASEGLRDGNPPSEKIPAFSQVEEELADAVIRVMDLSVHEGFDLAGAIDQTQASWPKVLGLWGDLNNHPCYYDGAVFPRWVWAKSGSRPCETR